MYRQRRSCGLEHYGSARVGLTGGERPCNTTRPSLPSGTTLTATSESAAPTVALRLREMKRTSTGAEPEEDWNASIMLILLRHVGRANCLFSIGCAVASTGSLSLPCWRNPRTLPR